MFRDYSPTKKSPEKYYFRGSFFITFNLLSDVSSTVFTLLNYFSKHISFLTKKTHFVFESPHLSFCRLYFLDYLINILLISTLEIFYKSRSGNILSVLLRLILKSFCRLNILPKPGQRIYKNRRTILYYCRLTTCLYALRPFSHREETPVSSR